MSQFEPLSFSSLVVYMATWRKHRKYIDLLMSENTFWIPLCESFCYAIHLGTQNFCAESVKSHLRILGFNDKLCRKTLQTLSSVSLRCSFELGLCQNSKSLALDHPVPSITLTQNQNRKRPTQMEYLPIMIVMLVLQFVLYHHLKLPISIVDLSIKGIHIMQMLF